MTKKTFNRSHKIYGCTSCGRIIEELIKGTEKQNQDVPYCNCCPNDGKIKMEEVETREENENQEEVLVRVLLKQRRI